MNKLSKLNLTSENLVACLLIAIFSVFLLVNFSSGFNLFLYTVAAVLGLMLSIFFPRGGLLALLVLTLVFVKFFTLQSFWFNDVEYKFYLVDLIMLGSVFGLFLRALAGKIKLRLKMPDVWLLAFMLLTSFYFLASLFYWDGDFATAFSSWKNYTFYPIIYFVALILLDSREHLKQFLKFLVFGSLLIIGFIIYGLIAGQGLWTDLTPLSTEGSRILDFGHAFYLCLVSLVGLVYLIVRKDKYNQLWYVLLPIFAVGIIGSLMRHLWIALLVALVFLYAIIYKQHKEIYRKIMTKYLAFGVMAAVALIFLVNLLPNWPLTQELVSVQSQVVSRATSLVDDTDTSIAWRNSVWQEVWKEYREHLVVGLGFGQKIFIDMGDYQDYVEVRNIHNSWLAILVQMGLVGFVVLLLFIFILLWKVIKKKDGTDLTLKLSVLCVSVFCLVAFAFQPYLEANFFNIVFWLNLALARRYYEGFTS